MSIGVDTDYVSVADAAMLLHVDPSTVRRWIENGRLPAYRVGHRFVRVKRNDLARVIAPVKPASKGNTASASSAEAHVRRTPEEKEAARAAASEARAMRHELRDRWGSRGHLLAYEEINLMREERDWQLS